MTAKRSRHMGKDRCRRAAHRRNGQVPAEGQEIHLLQCSCGSNRKIGIDYMHSQIGQRRIHPKDSRIYMDAVCIGIEIHSGMQVSAFLYGGIFYRPNHKTYENESAPKMLHDMAILSLSLLACNKIYLRRSFFTKRAHVMG